MTNEQPPGFTSRETVKATEACVLLGISYPTLNRWLKLGYLSYVKLPSKRRLIPLAEIQRVLKERQNQPPTGAP